MQQHKFRLQQLLWCPVEHLSSLLRLVQTDTSMASPAQSRMEARARLLAPLFIIGSIQNQTMIHLLEVRDAFVARACSPPRRTEDSV